MPSGRRRRPGTPAHFNPERETVCEGFRSGWLAGEQGACPPPGAGGGRGGEGVFYWENGEGGVRGLCEMVRGRARKTLFRARAGRKSLRGGQNFFSAG